MGKTLPSSNDAQFDFATLLEQSFEAESEVQRGDLLTGTIVAIDGHGMIVDVGLKRDGVIPRTDFEDLPREERQFNVGQEIMVMVVKPEDFDGNLVVSIKQARASKDWNAARLQMESGEIVMGEVVAANEGGLIIPYGQLRGFVPASHVVGIPRGLDSDARLAELNRLVGQQLEVKIIEVNPRRRRLVLSQREAQRHSRAKTKEDLLEALTEGDVVKGRVSSLRDFGAFIDLGGADGLVHVSELSWSRVRHPGELLQVGMEVEAYVLQLDRESKRIGLSLKRLQPNPWEVIAKDFDIGQTVEGTVTRLVSFGAFVELNNGIEALLHISQMRTPAPQTPEEVVEPGDRLTTRIISLEPDRQRIGLSLLGLDDVSADSDDDPVAEADATSV